MAEPQQLITPQSRQIAYHQSAGAGPGVMFLGGFKSDMAGAKAVYLADWALGQERAYMRFDYSGHGQSGGRFEDGCIGDWFEDAASMLALTEGPQVLVGSSMGGWIALLLARAMPDRIAGLVTVAAAPDFTEDSLWAGFSEAQRGAVLGGHLDVPSDYGAPYRITRWLIEDGRRHLVLRARLDLPFPVRMLQGTDDLDVPLERALLLLEHATGPDIRLSLVKGADHRFSTPQCLAMIGEAVKQVLGS